MLKLPAILWNSVYHIHKDSLPVSRHRLVSDSKAQAMYVDSSAFYLVAAYPDSMQVVLDFNIKPLVETWYPAMSLSHNFVDRFYVGFCDYENSWAQRKWDSDPDNDRDIQLSPASQAMRNALQNFINGRPAQWNGATIKPYKEVYYLRARQLRSDATKALKELQELFR